MTTNECQAGRKLIPRLLDGLDDWTEPCSEEAEGLLVVTQEDGSPPIPIPLCLAHGDSITRTVSDCEVMEMELPKKFLRSP